MKPLNSLFLSLLCALPLMAGASESACADTGLVPFELTYKVKARGITAGVSTLKLTKLSDTPCTKYAVSSLTEPKGLGRLASGGEVKETATFQIKQGNVQTLSAQTHDTVADPEEHSELVFDWTNKKMTGTYQAQAVEHALHETQGPQIDRASLQFAIAHDLMQSQLKTSYEFVDNDQIKTYQITDGGEHRLKIKGDRYNTRLLNLAREGSSRSLKVWYATELNYAPIKIEQYRKGKRQTEATLRSYKAR